MIYVCVIREKQMALGRIFFERHTVVGEIKTAIDPDSTGFDSLGFFVHVDLSLTTHVCFANNLG